MLDLYAGSLALCKIRTQWLYNNNRYKLPNYLNLSHINVKNNIIFQTIVYDFYFLFFSNFNIYIYNFINNINICISTFFLNLWYLQNIKERARTYHHYSITVNVRSIWCDKFYGFLIFKNNNYIYILKRNTAIYISIELELSKYYNFICHQLILLLGRAPSIIFESKYVTQLNWLPIISNELCFYGRRILTRLRYIFYQYIILKNFNIKYFIFTVYNINIKNALNNNYSNQNMHVTEDQSPSSDFFIPIWFYLNLIPWDATRINFINRKTVQTCYIVYNYFRNKVIKQNNYYINKYGRSLKQCNFFKQNNWPRKVILDGAAITIQKTPKPCMNLTPQDFILLKLGWCIRYDFAEPSCVHGIIKYIYLNDIINNFILKKFFKIYYIRQYSVMVNALDKSIFSKKIGGIEFGQILKNLKRRPETELFLQETDYSSDSDASDAAPVLNNSSQVGYRMEAVEYQIHPNYIGLTSLVFYYGEAPALLQQGCSVWYNITQGLCGDSTYAGRKKFQQVLISFFHKLHHICLENIDKSFIFIDTYIFNEYQSAETIFTQAILTYFPAVNPSAAALFSALVKYQTNIVNRLNAICAKGSPAIIIHINNMMDNFIQETSKFFDFYLLQTQTLELYKMLYATLTTWGQPCIEFMHYLTANIQQGGNYFKIYIYTQKFFNDRNFNFLNNIFISDYFNKIKGSALGYTGISQVMLIFTEILLDTGGSGSKDLNTFFYENLAALSDLQPADHASRIRSSFSNKSLIFYKPCSFVLQLLQNTINTVFLKYMVAFEVISIAVVTFIVDWLFKSLLPRPGRHCSIKKRIQTIAHRAYFINLFLQQKKIEYKLSRPRIKKRRKRQSLGELEYLQLSDIYNEIGDKYPVLPSTALAYYSDDESGDTADGVVEVPAVDVGWLEYNEYSEVELVPSTERTAPDARVLADGAAAADVQDTSSELETVWWDSGSDTVIMRSNSPNTSDPISFEEHEAFCSTTSEDCNTVVHLSEAFKRVLALLSSVDTEYERQMLESYSNISIWSVSEHSVPASAGSSEHNVAEVSTNSDVEEIRAWYHDTENLPSNAQISAQPLVLQNLITNEANVNLINPAPAYFSTDAVTQLVVIGNKQVLLEVLWVAQYNLLNTMHQISFLPRIVWLQYTSKQDMFINYMKFLEQEVEIITSDEESASDDASMLNTTDVIDEVAQKVCLLLLLELRESVFIQEYMAIYFNKNILF